jgi:hypothetical protein
LRDGSLWVGHFVTGDVELDFGDDRVDAGHGLARFVRSEATSSSKEARSGMEAGNGSVAPIAGGKIERFAKLDPLIARLKRAA